MAFLCLNFFEYCLYVLKMFVKNQFSFLYFHAKKYSMIYEYLYKETLRYLSISIDIIFTVKLQLLFCYAILNDVSKGWGVMGKYYIDFLSAVFNLIIYCPGDT